ncbi:SirB1 family protein [Paraglaciecola polaris]|uniref:Protein SirB1 N-terminal domain-containing protein n=1 Tax=Paraglaciecola polaris LMG 21857 TaxID=1129793 RepID=K7AHJ6_9ALTE|nr:tetratricopeptide repeat protein [Paraglaciecola polaris]GAC34715.1 hypothetical protein GPLA_3835 [Paraglaciecola polaris LMG 21857]
MQSLEQAIQSNQLLYAGLIASQHSVGDGMPVNVRECLQQLNRWSNRAKHFAHIHQPDANALKRFIQFFYRELAFSGTHNQGDSCQHSLMHEVMSYRSGTPVTLAIVFSSLAKRLGFKVSCINFPGHFLLRCELTHTADNGLAGLPAVLADCQSNRQNTPGSQGQYLFIDPLDGRVLSGDTLEKMYFSVIEDIDNESMPKEALEPASSDEVIVHMLNQIKAALINAKRYEQALRAIELLITLCPNNPYERRDRGVLLHELQCPQLAIIDYQYFIRQCPQDPAATLLAHQVKHMNTTPPVMH